MSWNLEFSFVNQRLNMQETSHEHGMKYFPSCWQGTTVNYQCPVQLYNWGYILLIQKWGGLRKVKGIKFLCVDTQSPEDKRDLSDKTCMSVYILTPNHLNIDPSHKTLCVSHCVLTPSHVKISMVCLNKHCAYLSVYWHQVTWRMTCLTKHCVYVYIQTPSHLKIRVACLTQQCAYVSV